MTIPQPYQLLIGHMFETEEQATDAYVDQCQQRLILWFALAFMAIYGLHLWGSIR